MQNSPQKIRKRYYPAKRLKLDRVSADRSLGGGNIFADALLPVMIKRQYRFDILATYSSGSSARTATIWAGSIFTVWPSGWVKVTRSGRPFPP